MTNLISCDILIKKINGLVVRKGINMMYTVITREYLNSDCYEALIKEQGFNFVYSYKHRQRCKTV